MELIETVKVDGGCDLSHFVPVADMLIRRPHLIKSRKNFVAGAKILSHHFFDFSPTDDIKLFELAALWQDQFSIGTLEVSSSDDISSQDLDYSESSKIFRKIIYKTGAADTTECILFRINDSGCSLHVIPLGQSTSESFENTKCHYAINFEKSTSELKLWLHKSVLDFTENSISSKWLQWLRFVCFPKFVGWFNDKLSPPTLSSVSLKLVSIDRYQYCYKRLKDKYFETLAENWRTESTNPEKFIHEDLAIASYLIALWEESGENPKSFIDLGCGNGLLVYILSQEGYSGGVGVDLRRRKIWDFFQNSGTDLRVETFEPKPEPLLKNYEWVIGNHSDELTPWIPLISSLSRCKFFLLPCCPFDFFAKFQRRSKNNSTTYRDYLDFVRGVGEKCGFVMEEDRLRIPSTKRICFIGRKFESSQLADDYIKNLAESGKKFEARAVIEEVRNCTKVDRNIQNDIIRIVVDHLLVSVDPDQKEMWNSGGTVAISRISELIPNQLLLAIKNEHGGLQTLFRNHRHIFVVEKGTIRLRTPGKEEAPPRGKKRSKSLNDKPIKKIKPCWFHQNHPQGCPLSDSDCCWEHSVISDAKT